MCASCGAQLVTRSEANFKKSKAGSFAMASIWCNTVGLVWGIVLLLAFSPAWTVFVNGKSNFPRTEWDCIVKAESTQHNNLKFPNAPKRVELQNLFVGKIETERLPFFGKQSPNCNLAGWREKLENNSHIEIAKKQGVRITYRALSEPRGEKNETRSTGILDTDRPIMKDYIYSIIFPCIVLLFGIPIGRGFNWIWRKLFGSGSDLVWVR